MTFQTDLLPRLYARGHGGMKLGLEAMSAACAELGIRWAASTYVHIAGTNGKGSTAAMVESAARADGHRTGLYTSPHLSRFAERIRLQGAPISEAALSGPLARALEKNLTFFETATLAALLAFEEAECDFVVLEVGLGGRLDATNVVPHPRVCAITSIGLDHETWLGTTRGAIAHEKAGILKPGVPCVLGPSLSAADDEARLAIAEDARDKGAPLLDTACVATGDYWLENRATAEAVLRALHVPEDAIARGVSSATWPGRFETISSKDGPFLLDGAHNIDGARALVATLRARSVHPAAIVFGAMGDKDFRASCTELRHAFPSVPMIFVEPEALGVPGASSATGPLPARAAAPKNRLAETFGGTAARDLPDGIAQAQMHAHGGTVLVTGSLYLVGAARALLRGEPSDLPIAL